MQLCHIIKIVGLYYTLSAYFSPTIKNSAFMAMTTENKGGGGEWQSVCAPSHTQKSNFFPRWTE